MNHAVQSDPVVEAKASPQPLNIHVYHPARRVEIDWDDGIKTRTDFAEFRRYCACAWCRQQRVIGQTPAPESAVIREISLVGEVGINIAFTDGHDRGLFPWEYLRAIAEGRVEDGRSGISRNE